MSHDDPRSLGTEPRPADEDRGLARLIALARKMPHTESARRDAVSYASFETKLFARAGSARQKRWQRAGALSFAGLATCAALALLSPGLRARVLAPGAQPISYRVQPIALVASGAEAAAQELAFSDGSRVQLAEHSEANVSELTSHGARVTLDHGRAEVSIARRKQAAWQMVAGPYTVRVTGTAFGLAWSKERDELEVAMHHGSVIVTGPMAEQGVVLEKGQRLIGSPRSRRLVVEDWPRKPENKEQHVAALPEVELSAEPSAKQARVPARVEHVRGFGEHGWAKKVAHGDFAGVLAEARALGQARVLAQANGSDLGALADAARYARQDALGQKSLLALRERFPGSDEARDSAFLLGRLSGDQRALSWYERYMKEQPGGAYVSQALGRSMMLYYERGDAALAQALARQYLARFPSGPYAASARKLADVADKPAPQSERVDHAAP